MTSRIQPTVVMGLALLVAVAFLMAIRHAHHPVAATGIALQTLAGFFAAVQLWANSASNSLVRWVERQIGSNRWKIAGLFDGRFRSLAITVTWSVSADAALRMLSVWGPSEIVGWPVSMLLLALFVLGVLTFCLALFMCMGAYFVRGQTLPDGEAMTALQDRLKANDWIWPIVAFFFVLGGILQLSAA